MKDWKNEVTLEMLPESHRKLAEVIGIEAMLKMCETFGGETRYIPMTDDIYAIVRRKWIREEYIQQGSKVRWLARKYGISQREVQRIVKGIRPDQIAMFD